MRTARIVTQALPVILISLLGEMFAGSIFGTMDRILDRTPGLLVMVPALLLLRGNINASLGSRLTSAVHLGLIPGDVPLDDPEVRVNIRASLVLGILMGIVAGVLGHIVSLIFSGTSAGWHRLVLIGATVGFLSGLPMVPATTRAVRYAFRRGLDPDNIIGPMMLTLGDIVTILLLFLIAGALVGYPGVVS